MNKLIRLVTTFAIILSILIVGKTALASEVTGNLSTGINSTIGNTVSGIVIVPPVTTSSGGSSSSTVSVAHVAVLPTPVVIAPAVIPVTLPNAVAPQVLGEQVVNVTAMEQSLVVRVDSALTRKLAGRILLQVENHGEAWYKVVWFV